MSSALLAGLANNAGSNGGKNGGLIMRYARTSFDWFISTWASMNVFGILLVRKQVSPCLLRGSLAYIFSGVLINMEHVKWVCVTIVSLCRNFLFTVGKWRVRKPFDSDWFSTRILHQLSIGDEKMLLLTERRNPCHFFSNWKLGAQPKLVRANYVFPLWSW